MSGGLGNQMFQYAFAKAYSLKHNCQVALDISFYQDWQKKSNITPRSYKLDQFSSTLPSTASAPFWARQFSSRIGRKLHDIFFSPLILVDAERGYKKSYIADFYSTKLFVGYFQTPRYFSEYREILLKDFILKSALSGFYKHHLEQIKATNSVSLHVRRGDYLLAQNSKIHGVLTLEYYQKAVDLISAKSDSLTFYIFSDDIDWCKAHLSINAPTVFIDAQKESSDVGDLILMSNCKHNIMANSSFSWWGAWLNQNSNKIVVAPENWFADKARLVEWEIYPPEWHVV